MGLILDSSAIIATERRGGLVSLLAAEQQGEPMVMPAIVWAEILVGVRRAKSPAAAAQRRAWMEALRQEIPIIDFDAKVAEHYADICAECYRSGRPVPQNDTAVAATARSLGYDVLVGPDDEAHFRGIKGLKVRVLRKA